jgi:hypothetical protein
MAFSQKLGLDANRRPLATDLSPGNASTSSLAVAQKILTSLFSVSRISKETGSACAVRGVEESRDRLSAFHQEIPRLDATLHWIA